jgi:hypothetical protein
VVHRLTRIRRREQDLFGAWGSVWQVIRTSNGYRFLDPLDREPAAVDGVSRKIRRDPRTEKKDRRSAL